MQTFLFISLSEGSINCSIKKIKKLQAVKFSAAQHLEACFKLFLTGHATLALRSAKNQRDALLEPKCLFDLCLHRPTIKKTHRWISLRPPKTPEYSLYLSVMYLSSQNDKTAHPL